MNTAYEIKKGILIAHNKKYSLFPLKLIIFLLFIAGSAYGGYFFTLKHFNILPDSKVLSLAEYNHYLYTERALSELLEEKLTQKDYVLTNEQMMDVIAKVFPNTPVKDELKEKYIKAANKWGKEYSIPPLLILCIIWRESSFNAATHSSANARGPMQVIYKHHDEKLKAIGKTEMDLHDIDVGVHIGTQIMREYFDRYKQDIFRTMRAYVGGNHSTYAQDILSRYFKARMYIAETYNKD